VVSSYLPFGTVILAILNTIVSLVLIAVLFAAIYKVLPDTKLQWRDVIVGALATSALFTIGKSLIGWYLGTSATGSTYGAAGALMVILLWTYYSSEIFLLGAEFTKVYAAHHGSQKAAAKLATESEAQSVPSVSQSRSQLGFGSLVTGVLMVSAIIGTFRNKKNSI
jgi:membrane protein